MKFNIINKDVFAVLFASFLLGSCTAEMDPLDNSVYIAEAEKEKAATVMLDDVAVTVPVTVRAALPVEEAVNVSLTVDPSALDAYNARYTQSYEMLPAEYYSFDKKETTIEVSQVSASPFVLELKPLSNEMLTSGK